MSKKIIKSKYRIYLDMDGVLTDFEAGFKNATGKATKDIPDEAERWAMVMDTKDFWKNLPVMPGAGKLLNYLKHHEHVMVLSSPGTSDAVRARAQKTGWLEGMIGSDIPVIFRRGRDKAEYAGHDSILIDDRSENVQGWISKGGIGIIHKNAELTIASLSKLKIFSEVDELTGE